MIENYFLDCSMTEPHILFKTIPIDVFVHHVAIFLAVQEISFCSNPDSIVQQPIRFHPNTFWPVWQHCLVDGTGWIPAAFLFLDISLEQVIPLLRSSFIKLLILRRAGSLPGAAIF